MSLIADPKRRDPSEVKKMFSRVSAHYDAINRAMCGGLDILWRKKLVRQALKQKTSGNRILDIACGSGDVCRELLRQDTSCHVTGADFCAEMLVLAREKCPSERAVFLEADCRNLPFEDDTFDAATISFGFRNFNDRPACLAEIARVLKSDAPLCVLEVARAGGVFESLQKIFMCRIVPTVALFFGGDKTDYQYLAKTTMNYPRGAEVEKMFRDAGFQNVRTIRLAFGMVAITSGVKN